MVDVIEQGARVLMQPMARSFRNSQCCYGDSRNCHENVGLKNNYDSGQGRLLRLRLAGRLRNRMPTNGSWSST